MLFKQWEGFKTGEWCEQIDVRGFIQLNYAPYLGGDGFLTGPTPATLKLWEDVMNLTQKEIKNGGVLDMDKRISGVDAFGPGYIDKKLEKIVGVQTDIPFKRAYMPISGIRMAKQAAETYGFKTDPEVDKIYQTYRKTPNQAIFEVYTPEMRSARKTHIITGLPDAYSRGRIIADYRRIALYGIDYLIEDKKRARAKLSNIMTEENIRLREQIMDQINAMDAMKRMSLAYGIDISLPSKTAQEAVQAVYFGYLAAVKDQNGAAMSIGRVSTFLDIYIQRDLKNNLINEQQAQELIDHFVMKLRIVKFMRTPEYNESFSGDPIWATESIGGMGLDGRTLVTKTSYRMIHTLSNMGPAPEPNLTILWSKKLPKPFKEFCAKYSIKYSSMQYESDDLMRYTHGDDYAIACCVSPMKIGKQMQFFGARTNLAKILLYSINSGHDEIHPEIVLGPKLEKLPQNKPLVFNEIMERFKKEMNWLASLYVNTLNIIHYMHDKYNYEACEMALHDLDIHRFFATGIAGLSVVTDSLSAIKYAKVIPIWKNDIAVDFKVEGEFPKYGNDDDRVDKIAVEIVEYFMNEIRKNKTYLNSEHTMSVLTITSNVVYGKNTGSTPDGRKVGVPFAPGANPMHGRDSNGAIASLASVAKIPFKHAADGISNTFSIVPDALGKDENLVTICENGINLKKCKCC